LDFRSSAAEDIPVCFIVSLFFVLCWASGCRRLTRHIQTHAQDEPQCDQQVALGIQLIFRRWENPNDLPRPLAEKEFAADLGPCT
jgi:hypothetical protein